MTISTGPVLVVEDIASVRELIEVQLRLRGYQVITARDGHEALDTIGQVRPSVVITDILMPRVDGFALAERIKQSSDLAQATIMMVTSGGQRGDAARCHKLGIAAYLTKPITQTELREAILMALRRPTARAVHAPVVTRHVLRTSRVQICVLLAEDNPVNQLVATRMLERRGCRVEVANNGQEGLETIRSQVPDIVISDIIMPVMDGKTFLKHKRADKALADIPTIIVSAVAEPMPEPDVRGVDQEVEQLAALGRAAATLRRILELSAAPA